MRTSIFFHGSPVIESGIDNDVVRKAYDPESRNKKKLEFINNPAITSLA